MCHFHVTFPVVKESPCQCRRPKFNPSVRKIPWRRKWKYIPVFLPGKSHEQGSWAVYSPWGFKRVGHDLGTKQTKKKEQQFMTCLRPWLLFCGEFTYQQVLIHIELTSVSPSVLFLGSLFISGTQGIKLPLFFYIIPVLISQSCFKSTTGWVF